MMKFVLTFIILMRAFNLSSLEKLDDKYLVYYGSEDASLQIVKYYSFMCPHCVELFRRDFTKIKSTHVDTQDIQYIFHPVPKDLLTVCAMDCFEKLNNLQKRAFLEVMLEEIDLGNIDFSINLMKRAMEVLGMTVSRLNEQEYLQNTKAFQEAFLFISQDGETISAVPTVEINGKLYAEEIPDFEFIHRMVRTHAKERGHAD